MLNFKSRSLGSSHFPFHFLLVSSQFPPEGAVLEGGEEGVHLRRRCKVRGARRGDIRPARRIKVVVKGETRVVAYG